MAGDIESEECCSENPRSKGILYVSRDEKGGGIKNLKSRNGYVIKVNK